MLYAFIFINFLNICEIFIWNISINVFFIINFSFLFVVLFHFLINFCIISAVFQFKNDL